MSSLHRRDFLTTSAASLAALSASAYAGAADKPNEKIILAVAGVHGRGQGLLHGFSGFEDVEIAYVCDPDRNVVAPALKAMHPRHKRAPRVVQDLRRALEDRDLRAELARKGPARAGEFTWERSARAHLAVYREAAL